MRVLLVAHRYFPAHRAGTEVLTAGIARALREAGHEAAVVAGETGPRGGPAALRRDRVDGAPVFRILQARSGDLRDHLDAPGERAILREAVADFQPDVAHATHLQAVSAGALDDLRRAGIPAVVTPTDYWTVCPRTTLFDERLQSVCSGPGDGAKCVACLAPASRLAGRPGLARAALRAAPLLAPWSARAARLRVLGGRPAAFAAALNGAKRILPATRFLADILVRHGVQPERVEVLPYGVDVGPLPPPAPAPGGFSAGEPLRVAFIGSLVPLKGPHVLLEALARLGPDAGRVKASLYGQAADPGYEERLRALAAPVGASLAGTFPPDAIGAVLRRHHLLVVPSLWYESTPLVQCAALEARVPVLVSRLGGMTEAVQEGVHGWSFAPGNAGELAARLAAILADPAAFARASRAMPVRGWPVRAHVGRLLQVYEEACAGREATSRR